MVPWVKLGSVAGLLLIATGCIQARTSINLTSSGAGGIHTMMSMSSQLLDLASATPEAKDELQPLLKGYPSKVRGSQRKELAEAGVSNVSFAKSTKDGFQWSMDALFASPSGLAALHDAFPTQTSSALVTLDPDGVYELKLGGDSLSLGEAGGMFEGLDLGQGAGSGGGQADVDPEMMQALWGMMGGMAEFSVGAELTVPGEIISFQPTWGQVRGNTIDWTLDLQGLMALVSTAGAGADPAAELAQGFKVRFKMPEGQELPIR